MFRAAPAVMGAGLLLTVAACSSSSPSAGPLPSIAAISAEPSQSAASPSSSGASPRPGACLNATATASVKDALVTADGRPGATESPGSTFYGTCGEIGYAVASFRPSSAATSDQGVAFQDHGAYPVFFVETAGGWKAVGSAAGPPGPLDCSGFTALPASLRTLWGDCAVAAPSPSSRSSASGSASGSTGAASAKAAALVQWKAGAKSDAVDLAGYLTRAAADLEGAVNKGAAGSDGFAAAASQLRDLASLPETDDTPAQMQEAKTDVTALEAFFGTPGLYS